MRRRFASLPLASIMMLASVAGAAPWFDAGIADYAVWPQTVTSWYVPCVGTWQGTADAELLQGEGLQFYANAGGRSLVFDEAKSPSVSPTIALTVVLPPRNVLPEVDPTAKGAVAVCRSATGTATNYCALVADGVTNRWVRFAAPVPKGDQAVTLTIAYRDEGQNSQIRYVIDGEALRMGDDEWLPIVLPGGSGRITAVDFRGGGEVRSFAGTTCEEPGAPVVLTIPPLEGMEVVSVRVATGGVSPEPDGTYRVPGGAWVAVRFAAEDGCFLSSDTMSFRAETADFVLPTAGRPNVLMARDFLRVNEIMASPATGSDWVELANTSAYPVDVSGWLLSDKASAKAKWSPIVGEAVIPAHGFLVVALGSEGNVHADLGLSDDGETVAFATPRGSLVDEFQFGFQFEGVSFGREASGTNLVYFTSPTPRAANASKGRSAPTPQVAFSVPHGYFTKSFTVALSCPEKTDAEIFYTTNGKSPTRASSRYTGPIAISQTTVLRAAVVDADSILQRDTSATYLFVDDIVRQSGTPPGFPTSGSVNGQVFHYGMRSSILSADGTRLTRGFTNEVRTVSLVIDPANLFNASTGIYVNARKEGRAWERAALVEQIHPLDSADGFSIPCGVRIRGAVSRGPTMPKHSFRLFFRGDYGVRRLEHPIFGAEGAAVCDKIDLRSDQNQAYANGDSYETMVHEVFSRDSMRDLGQFSPNTRYFHLFLNGIYWGLYMYEERVSQCYAAAVNGGSKNDYDVVRTQQPNYVTDLVEGEREAMEQVLRIVNQEGFSGPYAGNYNRIRGLDAGGMRDPALPVYLNVTNLVDFMLQVHSVSDADSPASASCFINQENNVMAFRYRPLDGGVCEDGFIFLRHDAEWSMGFTEYFKSATRGAQLDVTGLGRDFQTFCPSRFHWRLCDHAEYRMLVADRFYRHCLRSGGALTQAKNEARFRSRMAEIDEAIVGEVARWGSVPSSHANRETWLNACETYCLAFLRERPAYHLQHYRARGWYPAVDAPTLKNAAGMTVMDGTRFAAKTQLALETSSAGTLYVTEDGSDPRMIGGLVNRRARNCEDRTWEVPLGVTTLKARLLAPSGEWSALEEVRVVGTDARVEALKASLRVCEVMSSTREAGGDGEEFIVFTNLDQTATLDLTGVRVVCAKVGKSPSLDLTLSGSLSGIRTWRKSLDWADMKITNGQVEMTVLAPGGEVIQELFLDANWWEGACDGTGAFFVARDFGASLVGETQWRPSYRVPTSAESASAVSAFASGDDRRREWLVALGTTDAGGAAIAGFARDLRQLETCYLLGVAPENAELELRISRFEFTGDDTELLLDGALRIGGTNVTCSLNGQLKLRRSEMPGGEIMEEIELQNNLPFPVPIRIPVRRPRQFFRLLVQ